MSNDTWKSIRFPMRVGGAVCFDFTNTAEFRGSENFVETLRSYQHVLAWGWRLELISEAQAAHLNAIAAQLPDQAEAAYQQALTLREVIYRIFSAQIDQISPATADLDLFNAALKTVLCQRQVENHQSVFRWAWGGDTDDLTRVLWGITLSAAEMLTSNEIGRVRRCPNCGWLFLDSSRNGARRWCSMAICGSQTKSRRQYQRKLEAKNGE